MTAILYIPILLVIYGMLFRKAPIKEIPFVILGAIIIGSFPFRLKGASLGVAITIITSIALIKLKWMHPLLAYLIALVVSGIIIGNAFT